MNDSKINSERKLRFAFYVSGGASRLIKIIQQVPEIVENTFVVINDGGPNPVLKQLLVSGNIEYIEFSYTDLGLRKKERNKYLSKLLLEKFNTQKIDYAFSFGGILVEGPLLTEFENRFINFHPSLLPAFPGFMAIDKARNANSFLLGNTAHFIDEGIDTGPILLQSIIHASSFKEYEDVLDLQLPMIKQIVIWLIQDRIVVENNKVRIRDSVNNDILFFPKLEINLIK